MALTKKKTAKTYHKIGLCYKAGGFKDKAKEMFNKGMALDPDDDELKKDLKSLGR